MNDAQKYVMDCYIYRQALGLFYVRTISHPAHVCFAFFFFWGGPKAAWSRRVERQGKMKTVSVEEVVAANQKRSRPSESEDIVAVGDGNAAPSHVDGVTHAIAPSEASEYSAAPLAGGRRGKGSRSKRRKSVASDTSAAETVVVATEGRPSPDVGATGAAPSGATSESAARDSVPLAVAQNGEVVDREKNSALEAEFVSLKALGVRTKGLFEWVDGPLVTAMRNGEILLLDELSLAEDAVLERLNSVLEPGRSITLAEKGGEGAVGGQGAAEIVVAAPGFRYHCCIFHLYPRSQPPLTPRPPLAVVCGLLYFETIRVAEVAYSCAPSVWRG